MSRMSELDAMVQQEIERREEAVEDAVIRDLLAIGFLTPEDVEVYKHAKKYLGRQAE